MFTWFADTFQYITLKLTTERVCVCMGFDGEEIYSCGEEEVQCCGGEGVHCCEVGVVVVYMIG